MSVEKTVTYFEELGSENTEPTLLAAKKRADELGIREVTHSAGFREPGLQVFPEEVRKQIEEAGGKTVTAGHAFAGVSRAVRRKFNTLGPAELVAHVFRMFGQGMKVAVECASMAADAGAISMKGDIISIGGSGGGADTAIVLKPAHMHDMFNAYIREVISKPLNPRG